MTLGTICLLKTAVQGFEEHATTWEIGTSHLHKRAKKLKSKVGAVLEKEKRSRQVILGRGMEEKLDLTKNQGSEPGGGDLRR